MSTTSSGIKPPFSKDGRLQLCNRCNRYCGRTKNTCPTCDDRDTLWRESLSSLGLNMQKMKKAGYVADRKHFVGTLDGKIGHFLIWNPGMVLDRPTFREIAREATALGLEHPLVIYGRIATYMGPGIKFIQIGVE